MQRGTRERERGTRERERERERETTRRRSAYGEKSKTKQWMIDDTRFRW
jgi:hypothetical protein